MALPCKIKGKRIFKILEIKYFLLYSVYNKKQKLIQEYETFKIDRGREIKEIEMKRPRGECKLRIHSCITRGKN